MYSKINKINSKVSYTIERNTCDLCEEVEICIVYMIEGDRWIVICKSCLLNGVDKITIEEYLRKPH